MGRKISKTKKIDEGQEQLQGETENVSGIVDRLFYSSPSFTAGKLATDDLGSVSFTCKAQLSEGANVTLYGVWGWHEKYGRQFTAERVEHSIKLSVNGLALWLEKNGQARGIGRSKARQVAEAFGDRFDSVIMSSPYEIQQLAKLSDDQMASLCATWQAHRDSAKLITWLASFELSLHEIDKIKEKYGQSAYAILKDDPYVIIREIERFGFRRVDAIALKMCIDKCHPSRLQHGVRWVLREASDNGDTYVERDELLRKAEELLVLDRADAATLIESALQAAISEGSIVSDPAQTILMDAVLYRAERDVWTKIKKHGAGQNRVFDDDTISDDGETLIKSISPQLNSEQFNAVQLSLTSKIMLLSGGAGTGKTFTVDTIRLCYEYKNLSVGLCAPTGKAARRLEEVTGHAAHTIHRLLGFNPHVGWTYNKDKPLPYACVICDETSMVDSHLAYRLFDAIDFSATSLVLVGDHNQLPPVGPGNLLRDLIQSSAVPTVVLTEVVRQAGILKKNSSAILDGMLHKTTPDPENGGTPWQVITGLDDADECQQYITSAFREILINWPRTDIIHGIQILTPQKERAIGTKQLNIELQRIVQKQLYCVDVEPLPNSRSRPRFYLFDKVIQTRNDYDLDVMNGTIGYVSHTQGDKGEIRVEFEGKRGDTVVSKEKQGNLDLAYALTIHKAQGSEFPMVFLVAHRSHSFMANRSLLYTGATRAKQKLIIVGDTWGIRHFINTVVVDKRKTYLSKLLQNGGQ